jgi:hypothetical protein
MSLGEKSFASFDPSICGRFVAASIISVLCAICNPASAVNYPMGGSNHIATITFAFPQILGLPPEGVTDPYDSEHGYFDLKGGSGFAGGWVHVLATASNPPAQADFPADSTINFPVKVETNQVNSLPDTVRDRIKVTFKVISHPHWDQPGLIAPQTQIFANWSLTALQPSGLQQEVIFEAGSPIFWVDQDVTLRIEVQPDQTLVDQDVPPFIFSQQFRTIANPKWNSRPFLVPVAILGQPPGNKSSSKLAEDYSGSTSITVSKGSSVEHSESQTFGLGPFVEFGSTVKTSRSTDTGTTQTWSFGGTSSIATSNNYGIGQGDVLVALFRPNLDIYATQLDSDFRLKTSAPPPATVSFPMKELLSPQPSTPPGNLTQEERQYLRSLNPLLENPRAELDPRRYILVTRDYFDGAALGGEAKAGVIHRGDVTDAFSRSETNSSTFTLKIPLGALLSDIVSVVTGAHSGTDSSSTHSGDSGTGAPSDSTSIRSGDSDTVTVSYKNSNSISGNSDILASYQIGDSDPTKWLYVEIYYDTFWGTFVFRDVSPELSPRRAHVFGAGTFPTTTLAKWDVQEASGKFTLAGSLRQLVNRGSVVNIIPIRGTSDVVHSTVISSDTGNLLIPDIAPGEYLARAGNRAVTLTIDRQGKVNVGPLRPAQMVFPIVNQKTKKCLDIPDSSTAEQVQVQQYQCHSGANQHWGYQASGEIVNQNSGLCLDVPNSSTNSGIAIQQYHCQGEPNQLWRITDVGEIINQKSGKCLDIPGGATDDQVHLQQFDCNGGANQLWLFQ